MTTVLITKSKSSDDRKPREWTGGALDGLSGPSDLIEGAFEERIRPHTTTMEQIWAEVGDYIRDAQESYETDSSRPFDRPFPRKWRRG